MNTLHAQQRKLFKVVLIFTCKSQPRICEEHVPNCMLQKNIQKEKAIDVGDDKELYVEENNVHIDMD